MKVWLVGAGPGDPGLLTLRGRECLGEADVVVYDALANPAFLSFVKKDAELIYVGKVAGNHAKPQEDINALLASEARKGKNVVRLKGGDPYIFGRGGEEADYLRARGIPFEEVPGVSSAIAAPAYAGIPLTDRRAASALSIITGHESDLNRGAHNWRAYAESGATLVFLMGMRNLERICRNLADAGLAKDTPAAVIYRGCTPAQKTAQGTLADLPEKVASAGLANPAVIVIGKAVSFRENLSWYENLPLFGKRIAITRARARASDMARRLALLGAEVFECPLIKIEPVENYSLLDAAIEQLGEYAWVIFTSANGVKYFFERLEGMGRDCRALAGAQIAAIGPGTAQELARHGVRADLLPEKFVAESVAKAILQKGPVAGKKMLLPRAEEAREALPEILRENGAIVDVAAAYRNVAEEDVAFPDLRDLDCICFAASSAVSNFLKIFPPARVREANNLALAAIGPITARTLKEAGLAADIMPREYTIPALIEAIAHYFEKEGRC